MRKNSILNLPKIAYLSDINTDKISKISLQYFRSDNCMIRKKVLKIKSLS